MEMRFYGVGIYAPIALDRDQIRCRSGAGEETREQGREQPHDQRGLACRSDEQQL